MFPVFPCSWFLGLATILIWHAFLVRVIRVSLRVGGYGHGCHYGTPYSQRGVTTAPLNACRGVPPPRVCVSFACRKVHFPRIFLVFPFHRKCNFWIQWGRLNAADSRLTNWGVFAFVEITETKICLLIMLLTLRKLLLWHSGWRWSHWKWLQKILPIPMHSYLAQRHVCFDNTS